MINSATTVNHERVALLGWGSLLWDESKDFDTQHGPWMDDGPLLKLEFSRISKSRNGALTLVIDQVNGAANQVSYCLSKRTNITDVIADLQRRENSPTAKHVGYIDLKTTREHFADQVAVESIRTWTKEHDLTGVVWTDLPNNFQGSHGEPFSVQTAISYLNGLDADIRAKAMEYIIRAPIFVRTPLRESLENII